MSGKIDGAVGNLYMRFSLPCLPFSDSKEA